MKKANLVRTLILTGSFLLQLSTFCFQSRGAAGDVDLSFDPGSGVNGPVRAAALQPDGKVIIGGAFTTVKGLLRTNLARLNADGSGDSSFNPATGALHVNALGLHVDAVALQSDGKVLFSERWSDLYYDPDSEEYYYVASYRLARLNADGSRDTSFELAGEVEVVDSVVLAMAVQPDGKVLIGGYGLSVNGTNRSGIARLSANGSLDSTFNQGAGVSGGSVSSVALQPDGKVLIGGYFAKVDGTSRNGIARLNANGSLDTSFDPGTGATYSVFSIVVQSDGKVLIGGYFSTINGTNRSGIARLNADGSLDGSFNSGLIRDSHPYPPGVHSLVVQSDGKVLIGGIFSAVNGTSRNNFTRLNSDGSLDGTFNPGAGATGSLGPSVPYVSVVALQPDGKVVIGGVFSMVNGTNRSGIARLNADGSLDGSFHPGRGLENPVGGFTLQPDGKITFGNIRLNADGSRDSTYVPPANTNTFHPDLSFPGSDYTIVTTGAVQSDGKVLIGGYYVTTYVDPEGGITSWDTFFLLRFHVDGTRDTNFSPNIFPNGLVSWIVVQPDGRIIIAGYFYSVHGTNRIGIARLNANGSLDNSFNPGTGAHGVSSILLQADGKIFIAGGFASVNGTQRGGIARLNANGSLDNSFNPGTGANGSVASFVFQPDGKVLIGGSFTAVNGTNRNRIARLNANGSLDSSFNPGTGADNYVSSIALQPDGKVLIGGEFLTVNGVLRQYLARLHGDSIVVPPLNIRRSNVLVIVSWPVTGLNIQLQETTALSLPNSWSPVAQLAVTNAGQISVTVPAIAGPKFFRLKSQ